MAGIKYIPDEAYDDFMWDEHTQSWVERGGPYVDDPDLDGTFLVRVVRLVRDEGSVVVFSGFRGDGTRPLFAVEHRAAQPIIEALLSDDPEDDVERLVRIESWQIIGSEEAGDAA